ncbi:MAG TPA: hypothetical protein VFG50_10580 [Rhodothermales bacterium]|nr:hypothetical protein [Rhodothermales bacterium]
MLTSEHTYRKLNALAGYDKYTRDEAARLHGTLSNIAHLIADINAETADEPAKSHPVCPRVDRGASRPGL